MAKQIHVGMLTSLINSLHSISCDEINLAWSRHENEATHVQNKQLAYLHEQAHKRQNNNKK